MQNMGIVWDPETGPGERVRQASPGAVRRVHPVPWRARQAHRPARPDPARLRAGRRTACSTSARCTVGDVICFEVAYDGLVRDVIDGGGAAARRADQQRDLHRHRSARAAVRDLALPRDRDRSHRRRRRDQRHQRRSSRPTAPSLARRDRSAPARCSTSEVPLGDGLTLGRAVRVLGRARAGARRRAGLASARFGWTVVTGWQSTGAGDAHRRLGVLVVIPTYNEAENIESIVDRVLQRRPGDRRAGRRRRLSGRHRRDRRQGRGARGPARARAAPDRQGRPRAPPTWPGSPGDSSAGTTSWSRWTPTARTSPSSCRALLAALGSADLVLGARWVPGGSVVNWPQSRERAVAGRQHLRPAGARPPACTTRPVASGPSVAATLEAHRPATA